MDYFLAAFLFALLAYVLRALATARIKRNHPDEWIRLWRPELIEQGPSDIGSISITKFFFRGEFFRINDPLLQLLCIAFDVSVIVGVILMVLAAIGPEQVA